MGAKANKVEAAKALLILYILCQSNLLNIYVRPNR